VYVPFKVNGWEQIATRPRVGPNGAYVLCAGRTLRDIETFVEAMRRAGHPGVLLQQRRELLDAHGTSTWSGELPPNVELIIDDGDRLDDYLDFIAKARLVVIPRFKRDIAPTGISTYLVAMALNKCVVISDGPGASDVLDGQAAIVPPENVQALAEQISLLWDDAQLRGAIASRGHDYAITLGGEERLLSDILRASVIVV
jgi:glycosyltransferase involved in cell wall biosynthesis